MNQTKAQINRQVLEMINHIPLRDLLKIPPNVIHDLEENISSEKVENVTFSREAYVLFLKIYLEYIADENEKEQINGMLKLNENKQEKEKAIKYNPDNIFKTVSKENKKEEIIVVEKKWYEKLFDKIKKLFKK